MTASGVATPTYLDIEKSASITNSPSGLSSRFPFRIKEIDENGELCRIYESRPSVNNSFDTTRLTSHLMPTSKVSLNSVSTVQYLVNVFLPTGYPYSVTPNYFDYQIFDSFQAFSSSIASLFANRAVLSAVGVGDQSASSTSALFMKIVQETIGRLGTIGFAWKFGSALEPECKKYRFMADIFNDSAMVFDCLSPLFPFDKKLVVGMLCMSGLLRSICGVMAGGSRAALTQHFTDPVRGSIAGCQRKGSIAGDCDLAYGDARWLFGCRGRERRGGCNVGCCCNFANAPSLDQLPGSFKCCFEKPEPATGKYSFF